ncbi:MAG: hemerythrin domain-containing protein [Chitinispirillaceae bacterium]
MAGQLFDELFERIKNDHENIQELLEQLRRTGANHYRRRMGLLMSLREQLEPHMRAEEHVIYPALRVDEETDEDALDAVEEHHMAQILLDELEMLPATNEHWGAKLRVLKDLISRHIDEEENRIFDDIREVVASDKQLQLARQFIEAKTGALYAAVKPLEHFQ